MGIDISDGNIFGFILVLTRIGAFFAASPLFSWQTIPVRGKVTIALILSFFFAMITPSPPPGEAPHLIEAVVRIADETFYGLAMGLVAYSLLAVIRVAGNIIARQMGLRMGNVLDPFMGEQGQPIGMLLEIIFVMMLFQIDGHHLLLQILSRSFEGYPLGAGPSAEVLLGSVLKAGSAMLMLALQMAAPILAVFLLLLVVLAIMARIAPEANVLFLSLPLRCGLGLLMVGMFLPFIAAYLRQFTLWLDRLLPV